MKKILIVGANGFTGRKILTDLLKKNYDVAGCSLSNDQFPDSGYHFIQTDLREETQVKELFNTVKPDVVINTAALSVPDYCETHRNEAYSTNVSAVNTLIRYCNEYNARLIHLSTDFVFNGKTKQLYAEEDTPDSVNYYGKTKLEAEQNISKLSSDYAIARVVVVYGKSLRGQHGNIVELVANRLRNGEIIKVVSDQWRTPTFVDDVSDGVAKLINHPHNGIFHICGPECLSIADMAYKVASFLQLDSSLIQPVTTLEMAESTPRPCFSGLNIDKAKRELNYCPHTFEEGLKEMFA